MRKRYILDTSPDSLVYVEELQDELELTIIEDKLQMKKASVRLTEQQFNKFCDLRYHVHSVRIREEAIASEPTQTEVPYNVEE